MNEESVDLNVVAARGEKAARLLESEDFHECLRAFSAKCMMEETEFLPGQAGLWALKRTARMTIEDLVTFLEGVQAEGQAARAKLQGEDVGKKVIIHG